MISLAEYNHTNELEIERLKEVEHGNKKFLDKVIGWLTFIVLIAFVIFKERT